MRKNIHGLLLQETFDNVSADVALARQENFVFGAKIVRGAYIVLVWNCTISVLLRASGCFHQVIGFLRTFPLSFVLQERQRAAEMRYTDPINPTFEATTAMYTKVVDHLLEDIKSPNRTNMTHGISHKKLHTFNLSKSPLNK